MGKRQSHHIRMFTADVTGRFYACNTLNKSDDVNIITLEDWLAEELSQGYILAHTDLREHTGEMRLFVMLFYNPKVAAGMLETEPVFPSNEHNKGLN